KLLLDGAVRVTLLSQDLAQIQMSGPIVGKLGEQSLRQLCGLIVVSIRLVVQLEPCSRRHFMRVISQSKLDLFRHPLLASLKKIDQGLNTMRVAALRVVA